MAALRHLFASVKHIEAEQKYQFQPEMTKKPGSQ